MPSYSRHKAGAPVSFGHICSFNISFFSYSILARLDEVQEELLYYPVVGVGVGVGGGVGVSKMFKFYVKVRRFLSLRYIMTSNVPFEKNKMASTLAASVIITWSVHKMQGG